MNELTGNQSGQPEQISPQAEADLSVILKGKWSERLNTNNFEDAQASLTELKAFRQWRLDSQRHALVPFYKLFETASVVNGIPVSDKEREHLISDLSDRLTPVIQTLSPRLRDIYMALLSEIDGSSYIPQFEMTTDKIARLKESGDLGVLLDPNVSWSIKQNRMEARIIGDLRGRRAFDKRDVRKAEKEKKEVIDNNEEPSSPPPTQYKTKPSMDKTQELKEGEMASALWTISPAHREYFKEDTYDIWDEENHTWSKSGNDRYSVIEPILAARAREKTDLILTAYINQNQLISIPVPYTHNPYSISSYYGSLSILNFGKNEKGDYIIFSKRDDNQGKSKIDVVLVANSNKLARDNPSVTPKFQVMLTQKTEDHLQKVQQAKKTNLQKARALASYTMKHLIYSNDDSYNSLYDSHTKGYVGGIDELRHADCDVANTYFAALCSQINIPVRFIVGHMVKGKDAQGNSRITSGTGHAWCEVWDETESKWVKVDATPPGDPNMEEKQEKGEGVPGDYGEQEAPVPTDEELAKLESQFSELTERLSYTPAERELAEATGVDLKEARAIVKEIQKAEGTRLKNGELVVDVLSQLFSRIVEIRKTSKPDYTGPRRKREGGEEIEDIVSHVLGIKSGEADPISRQISQEKIHQAAAFGGFDVYFVGDKSGSMSQTVDGETKWRIQRQAQYLILSSLHRFSENLKRAETIMTDPLNVRTQAISFRDSDEIDVDKPLSSQFTPVDKVVLWKSLGNQGSGNGDIAALTQIYEQIKTEVAETEKQGKKDNRLRIIIACSDGYPDDERMVHQLAADLGKLNTVVVGVGLTETAAKVPIIFDTPYSRGDIARDINDLPAIVAKHVIMEAIRLFPDKSRESVESYIKSTLLKLKGI